jgi:hypothetical protein
VRDDHGILLDVFVGSDLLNLNRIAKNDGRAYQNGLSGAVTIPVRAGRTYYIRVDDTSITPGSPVAPGTPIAFSPPPRFDLTIEPASTPPEGEIYASLLHPGASARTLASAAKVYLPDGKTPVTGSSFHAQLYIGENPKTLFPAGPQQPFYDVGDTNIPSSGLGTFEPAIVHTPRIPAYHSIYAQVRVWDSSYGDTYETASANGGLSGMSRGVRMITGSDITGPAALSGIASFRLH